MPTIKTKIWLSVAAIFVAGALAVNAVWVHFYNVVDKRHVHQIDELTERYANRIAGMERSHKRELGQMRNRVEKKIDRVLEKLDKLPSTPIVIETRRDLEGVKKMIESIIAVAVLIVGAFFAGVRSSVNKQKKRDLDAMRDARKNYEKVSRMDDDDQLDEFDRLRENAGSFCDAYVVVDMPGSEAAKIERQYRDRILANESLSV